MISDLYIMEKQDLRTVPEPAREELRKRGIRMLGIGKRKKEVAEVLGVNKNRVTNRSKKYKAQGSKGPKGRKCDPKAKTETNETSSTILLIIDCIANPLRHSLISTKTRIAHFYCGKYRITPSAVNSSPFG